MSHIVEMDIQIQSLAALKAACQRLGLQFVENARTFRAFSTGQCDHKIIVPNAGYDIGVVQTESGGYSLLWDQWHQGKLTKVLGHDAGRLKQAYGLEYAKLLARQKKRIAHEQQLSDRIRLYIQL
jgi:hypothetical protein